MNRLTYSLALLAFLFGFSACKKNPAENKVVPDCTNEAYTAPQYIQDQINLFINNSIYIDPLTGFSRGEFMMGDTLSVECQMNWSNVGSWGANASTTVFFKKWFPHQDSISVQQAYDMLAPGPYSFHRSGENVWVAVTVQFTPSQPSDDDWHTLNAEDPQSSFVIEERSAIYVENGQTLCRLKGRFCCVVYTNSGEAKAASGNFSGKMRLDHW